MKKNLTQKISLSFLAVILMAACFATAGYSDSFVDENTLSALQDFRFGHSASHETQGDDAALQNTNRVAFKGDSFVGATVLEALIDFRFGVAHDSEPAKTQARTQMIKGDSFVDASVIKQLDDLAFFKGSRADESSVVDHHGLLGKN